jgi:hypothetical protein
MGTSRNADEHLTLVGSCEASRGKIEDDYDLFAAQVEPRHEVFNGGACFSLS